jgi:MoxR-like ATPase
VTHPELHERLERFQALFERVREEIARTVVGQDRAVELVLTALFADGHCLMEGVPGLGKTLLVRTLAAAVGLEFKRIQFTPDLMPADITGTAILAPTPDGGRAFRLQPGPIFAGLVLADEINRASPKTQSALLEAMQERRVTIGRRARPLPRPFLVLATQNPIEMEGTFPLPEAQLDRFLLKVTVGRVDAPALAEVMDRTTGRTICEPRCVASTEEILDAQQTVRTLYAAPHVGEWAARITDACRPEARLPGLRLDRLLRYGVSPRGAQALLLAGKVRAAARGRLNLSHDDIAAVCLPALRHRIGLTYEAVAGGWTADRVVDAVLDRLNDRRLRRLGLRY